MIDNEVDYEWGLASLANVVIEAMEEDMVDPIWSSIFQGVLGYAFGGDDSIALGPGCVEWVKERIQEIKQGQDG